MWGGWDSSCLLFQTGFYPSREAFREELILKLPAYMYTEGVGIAFMQHVANSQTCNCEWWFILHYFLVTPKPQRWTYCKWTFLLNLFNLAAKLKLIQNIQSLCIVLVMQGTVSRVILTYIYLYFKAVPHENV